MRPRARAGVPALAGVPPRGLPPRARGAGGVGRDGPRGGHGALRSRPAARGRRAVARLGGPRAMGADGSGRRARAPRTRRAGRGPQRGRPARSRPARAAAGPRGVGTGLPGGRVPQRRRAVPVTARTRVPDPAGGHALAPLRRPGRLRGAARARARLDGRVGRHGAGRRGRRRRSRRCGQPRSRRVAHGPHHRGRGARVDGLGRGLRRRPRAPTGCGDRTHGRVARGGCDQRARRLAGGPGRTRSGARPARLAAARHRRGSGSCTPERWERLGRGRGGVCSWTGFWPPFQGLVRIGPSRPRVVTAWRHASCCSNWCSTS